MPALLQATPLVIVHNKDSEEKSKTCDFPVPVAPMTEIKGGNIFAEGGFRNRNVDFRREKSFMKRAARAAVMELEEGH